MDGILPAVWVSGKLTDARSASVPVFDHGITVGDGVFETAKIVRGRPFALRRHLERMTRSAAGLGLPRPDLERVAVAIDAVIEANDLADDTGAVVRVTYTAGDGPLGSSRSKDSTTTLIVAAATMRAWAPTSRVLIVPWVRNERGALSGLKTTSYGENVVALAAAHGTGADEAIFANTRNELCEGTGTNVFVVVGGRVLTPPLASGCLAGITRELVLETGLATESELPIDALRSADEAFLTSSTRDVQPIASVDSAPLPAAPGPATTEVARAFADLVAASTDP
ncbi:MAG: aminodeoxychorismate lyase [Acidimicrobiales bacterium]